MLINTTSIEPRPISVENWRATLQIAVYPEQQRFVSEHTPIAALVLAKAAVGAAGLIWQPYALYAGPALVGLAALAHAPHDPARVWLFHLAIDYRWQGRGYGRAALRALIALAPQLYPLHQQLALTVHPANWRAQALYRSAGFQLSAEQIDGEPVYLLPRFNSDRNAL